MNTIDQEYQYVLKMIRAMDNKRQLIYIERLILEFSQKWIKKTNITDGSYQDYMAKLRFEKENKLKYLP